MKFSHFTMLCLTLTGTMATSCSGNREHLKSLDKAYVNDSIAPGDDFYTYVNYGWQKAHPLTGEYSRYGQCLIRPDDADRGGSE
ncbi:MAG: M13 family metallopeptidase, partial [Muribaculaceae bacterium]|nr:M13 family metallopeptidase [Muribaculaceae bacterium]